MIYRKKSFYMLSLLVLLTACGGSQEDTTQEQTQEKTTEVQDKVSTNDSDESNEVTDSVSETTNEVQAEETATAEAESEFQWLYDELNGKSFIFSSGVGAWRTSFSFLEDGEFS